MPHVCGQQPRTPKTVASVRLCAAGTPVDTDDSTRSVRRQKIRAVILATAYRMRVNGCAESVVVRSSGVWQYAVRHDPPHSIFQRRRVGVHIGSKSDKCFCKFRGHKLPARLMHGTSVITPLTQAGPGNVTYESGLSNVRRSPLPGPATMS